MKQPWNKAGSEPAFWDVLADPIVMSLMKADRVSRNDVVRASTSRCDPPRHQTEPVPA